MFSIKDIIDIAIHIERNGENIYKNAAKKTFDPSLNALLQRLAEEEGKHMQHLKDVLNGK